MKKPALPLTRRFHRRRGAKLRSWEVALLLALHAKSPEHRLWANVLSESLYIVYRCRRGPEVQREVDWLLSPETDSIQCAIECAHALGLEAEDMQRDVRSDVVSGKLPAKDITC